MKNFLTILIMLMFCNVITFAEIKTFTKEATEVVPENQSQAQVIAYLTQKLTRQAQEEAGAFITSEFSVKNKQITKDEFTSVAGSISKVAVENKETFTKDNQQYVKVKINIEVDTDSIQPYLDKILQDNQYKREADELRKKTLELEEKLKTATKKQYEQELSAQVQQQMELQKQRAIELNKMAIQAKEEYARAEQDQKQKELKRQEELNALQKQIEQENLKTQQKIAQEKDNIKKAELENQSKIRELENKAKENMINWQQTTNRTTIEQAIEEATKVKQEVNELFDKFEKLSKTNKEDLIKSYDIQINILKTTEFQEQKPVKDSWETQNEYNARLQKYEYNKEIFKENADKKIKELEQTKDDNLLKEELGTSNSTINTTKPFIDKLKYFQTEKFYSKDGIKAKLISIGEINVEEQYFVLNINYENKDYSLKYDFSNIGREKAKLMCQTQNQFVIEPLFSVNNNLTKELTSFNIKHLGTSQEKDINIVTKVNQLDEINKIDLYIQNFKEKEKELNTNKQIRNYFNFDVEPYELFISDEKFNSVYLNDECVILKKGKHIGVYDNNFFRNYTEGYISEDMRHILTKEDNTYTVYNRTDGSFDHYGSINFEINDIHGTYIKISEHEYLKKKNDLSKFNRNIEQPSYFNSISYGNICLQIIVSGNKISIKNKTTNKIYKNLEFDEKITSANFSNNGKKIVILLNQKKVLLWNFSN